MPIEGPDRTPATCAHHAIDPDVGLEFMIENWNDALPWLIKHRPIGADGWQQWSPPVELHEVREAGA